MRYRHAMPAIAGILLVALGCAGCSSSHATTSTSTTTATTAVPPLPGAAVYTWGVVGNGITDFGPKNGLVNKVPTPVHGIVGTVVQIATSNSDSYALTSSGTVWAWGAGSTGELGNGSKTAAAKTAVQVHFPAGVKIASLPDPMPFNTGMAIDSTGDAWGWGFNRRNQLCLPGGGKQFVPKKTPFTDVTLATGAGGHTVWDSKGKVYACGLNADGELGDGSTADSTTPVAVVGLPSGPVKALVSSWQGSGALMADGSYYDWGFNKTGQLGDGKTTNGTSAVRVSLPATVAQVSQGGLSGANGQTLALLSNGQLWAWGNDASGQLGNGTKNNASTPIRITLPTGVTFTQVNSGGATSYAIDSTGHLWSWGQNDVGEVGDKGKRPKQFELESIGIMLTQVSSTARNVAGFFKG